MKVALTYFLAGSGHFREAYSIAKSLRKLGHTADLIDIEERLAGSNKAVAKIFLWYYRSLIKAFLLFGERPAVEDLDQKASLKSKFTEWLLAGLRKLEQRFGTWIGKDFGLAGYDVVVSTHPMASVLAVGAGCPKVINICPDETGEVSSSFYKVDNILTGVNSPRVLNIFNKLGFNGDIRVVGHPLDPDILDRRQQVYERIQRNLSTGDICLGVFAGWITPTDQRSGILSVAKELAKIIPQEKISVKFLVGNHHDLEKELREIFNSPDVLDQVEIVVTGSVGELVEVGHRLLAEDVDILFSRPSEMVFYSLALGMPHILFPGIGPGEEDMFRLLQKYAPVKPYTETTGYLQHYLHNQQNLIDMSTDLYGSGYNFSGAENIASLLNV